MAIFVKCAGEYSESNEPLNNCSCLETCEETYYSISKSEADFPSEMMSVNFAELFEVDDLSYFR